MFALTSTDAKYTDGTVLYALFLFLFLFFSNIRYPALQAWFSRMKQVPYYSEINVVSKELGDLTKDVPQKTIATANKRGIKAVVAAAARVSKL